MMTEKWTSWAITFLLFFMNLGIDEGCTFVFLQNLHYMEDLHLLVEYKHACVFGILKNYFKFQKNICTVLPELPLLGVQDWLHGPNSPQSPIFPSTTIFSSAGSETPWPFLSLYFPSWDCCTDRIFTFTYRKDVVNNQQNVNLNFLHTCLMLPFAIKDSSIVRESWSMTFLLLK